jgi:protein-S-isoprenylcysteine O-methyltransferase Ste14
MGSRITTYIGAFLLILIALIRIQTILLQGTGSLISFLLVAQFGIAGILLVFRRRQEHRQVPRYVNLLAWLSAVLPLLLRAASAISLFNMAVVFGMIAPGLLLALWALVAMGRVFGIAPAYRGLVMRGPYLLLRHPMYAGELLSFIGTLILSFNLWNAGILLVFLLSVLWRIRWEETILTYHNLTYQTYAEKTKWRLIPLIW